MRCVELACAHPAAAGEYRVFNQFTEQFSVRQLADLAAAAAARLGLATRIENIDDPRVEAQHHHYNARHSKLTDLGLEPHLLSEGLLQSILSVAVTYRDRIDAATLHPRVDWRRPSNPRGRTPPGERAATSPRYAHARRV